MTKQTPSAGKSIVIIGAGMSGLSLHHYLKAEAKAQNIDINITLIESSSTAGGVLASEQRDGFVLEHGPDCFITDKPQAIALAKELGMEDQLISTNPAHRRSYIYENGRLNAVPEGLYLMAPTKMVPFLFSPLLSIRGKLRVMMEPWIPKLKSDDPSHDESLASFVRRRFGREMLDKIAQPMIAGIYTADPETLSLRATMPRFLDLESKYGSVIKGLLKSSMQKGTSGPRYSLFASFKDGMATLSKKLQGEIEPQNIRLNRRVEKIQELPGNRWALDLGEEKIEADILCFCTPTHEAQRILENSPLASIVPTTEYASTAILHFAYAKSQMRVKFDGMGFIVPHHLRKNIMACSFLSNKFENRAPEGFHLVRAFCGGKLNESILQHDDAELTKKVEQELMTILGIQGAPLFTTIQRWNKRMPQYTLGHTARIRAFEETLKKHPSLFLSGNYFNGVGIPDVIRKAKETAQAIVTSLDK